MADNYNIGSSVNQIALEADISTIGLAASRAIVLEVAGSGPGTAVAHSVDATGSIENQSIGDSTSLKGMRLSVFTKISLTGPDAASRAIEVANINSEYTLDGGDDGQKTFNDASVTYIDPNVFLNFIIDFQ